MNKEELQANGKVILIVKAYPNYELNKPEFDWEFPNNCPTSTMLGVMDLIKADLIDNWRDNSGAYEDE
jgi:hypothetical protein